jgi:hypothetical protein
MRLKYSRLTVFHAAMYFSMQYLTQLTSFRDKLAPGLGTHFSKQISLMF